jgi:hypothetical protein
MIKFIHLLLVISILVNASVLLNAQPIPADSLYLGQTPPANVPKIFNLPLTTGLRPVERIAVSINGKEIYYGELNTYPPTIQKTKCLKYLDNHWQGPFDVFIGFAAPRLSVNDSTMYVQANIGDFSSTYFSKRTGSGWSTPVKLLNINQQTHYFQTTGLNNSYLSSNLPASPSQRDICRLVITGSDSTIRGLGAPINTTSDENDLFVADDESFLLFSRNGTSGGGDIYLSFKKDNGGWTNPKKLGDQINKPGNSWEYGQFISKDGKYLFFTRGGSAMSSYYTYWVKIDNIIDSLRHTDFIPYLNYQVPNQSGQTGQLFTYTIPDSTFIDDDGNNTLTYSAALSNGNPLPSWLSFNSVTKTFTGTPTESANLSIKLTVTDTANAIFSCTFALNVSVSGLEIAGNRLPGSFNLCQNYPNPFNPATTINYSIAEGGNVKLTVFNSVGSKVAAILNEYKPAGNYSVRFNGDNLPSGLYFYRLESGNYSAAKKLILLK